jgi:hypothetical protein
LTGRKPSLCKVSLTDIVRSTGAAHLCRHPAWLQPPLNNWEVAV